MSYYDYEISRKLAAEWSFYGLLMAAMRAADSINAELLRGAFPKVWDELQDRYNAPGGRLTGEG